MTLVTKFNELVETTVGLASTVADRFKVVDQAVAAKVDEEALTAALVEKADAADLEAKADALAVAESLLAKADVDALESGLASKADDDAVLKVSGNQDVSGVKNFTSAPGVPDDAFSLAKTDGLQPALDARVKTAVIPINAADFGASRNRDTLERALDAAELRGRGSVVYVDGTWDVGNGLSMAGRTSVLRGRNGSAGTGSTPAGSTIYASTQSGPVVDFTGWIPPTPTFMKKITVLEGVQVRGSGQADPTKANVGVRFTTLNSATVRDISIEGTGGPCLELASKPGNGVYLCDFERVILNRPIGADVNDVPFFIGFEPNGNRFRSFGLMIPQGHSSNIGVSGAVIVEDNPTFGPHDNLFDAWWVEHVHVPSGGTIFSFKANQSVYRDIQFFDIEKVDASATGTSFFRFLPLTGNPVYDLGGNLLTGPIPGKNTLPVALDMGVDMRQSRNRVWGTKGYRGTNVVIAAGVSDTDVDLAGSVSTATDPAVVDNSGNATNTYNDGYLKKSSHGAYVADASVAQLGPGPRFYNPTTPANGGVGLGTSGVRWQSVSTGMYGTADNFFLRKIDLTPAALYLGQSTAEPSIRQGTGSPEGVVVAAPGSLYLNKAGVAGATIWEKQAGTGNTGWSAITSGGSGGAVNGDGVRQIVPGAYYGPGSGVTSTAATVANRLSAMPLWVPEAFTAVSIECEVTALAAGGTIRLGIYAAAPTTDKPGALVLDAGTVTTDASGVKALTISQALEPGLYWLTAVPQGGAPTVRTVQGHLPPVAVAAFAANAASGYVADNIAGALPDQMPGLSTTTTATKVMVKASA